MRYIILLILLGVVFVSPLSFAEVPEHNPDLDSQCGEGFQWSRGTISCKQADCPEGAGRTYTYECNCGEAWDKPFRTCYDPQRPGYAIACVAAGSPCPGEQQGGGPGSIPDNQTPPSAESCDFDSDCPFGYKCNPATNRCEQKVPEEKKCNDLLCFFQGGSCINDECVIENKCQNVTCDNKCESNTFKYGGTCAEDTGECTYTETACKNGCSSSGKRCAISVGSVNFIDIDNVTKPLKFVRVEAAWYDELGTLREALSTRYSLDDGSVLFTVDDLDAYDNGSFSVTVVFEDILKDIQVVDASGLSANPAPTPAQRLAAPLANYTKSIVISPATNSFDMNLTLDRNIGAAKYAKVYYHAMEAAEFLSGGLGVTQLNQPERFYIDDSNRTKGAYHGHDPHIGIVFSPRTSRFTNPESPTNREWHEFGHHIMNKTYGYTVCCNVKNHGGYYTNPDSSDSYTEGFAEFMSMMMLDYYNYPNKNLYFVGRSPFDMEINYRVYERVGNVPNEELALASIYYDLLDGGPNDEDGIQLTREQIWQVLSTQHNLDGAPKNILTIWDAYRAFNNTNLPGIHDQWGSVPFFVSKWDRIFITHGVYSDENGDGFWEPGEKVGYTTRYGVARASDASGEEFNRPEVDGSYIKLDVQDEETGEVVDYYPIQVVVHVEGTEEGEPVTYDYEFDTVPDENGEININMPPEEYTTTMEFSLGGDENYEQKSNVFELTSNDFYENLDPEIHTLDTYASTLKPKPKPIEPPVITGPGKTPNMKEILRKTCPCSSAFLLLLLTGIIITRKG